MNGNNSVPDSGTGTPVLEPPEQPTRIDPQPQEMPTGQPPLVTPTYNLYPPSQAEQPRYLYQPASQPPEPTQPLPPAQRPEPRQGTSPWVIILAILGGVLLLGVIFTIAMVFFVSSIVGQVTNPTVGELRTETESVALGEAKSAVVDINMGVGKLAVSGGASDLMNATFTYNVASWKPTVSYNVEGTQGTLLVEQPSQSSTNLGTNVRYEWDLLFNNDVPMTMKVNVGVGESDLIFGGIDLSKLVVNCGVGDTTIDLSGEWQQDTAVMVNGGVGQVTIILPKDTGVRVTADGGLGAINANEMTVNGNTYTNAAYGDAAHTINIDVKTGIGSIQLVQEK